MQTMMLAKVSWCINNQCVADDDTGRNGVDTRNWYVMVVTGTSQLKTHVHYKAATMKKTTVRMPMTHVAIVEADEQVELPRGAART